MKTLSALLLSLALFACDDGDDGHHHHHGGESLADEACEHTAEGPFQDVTATAEASGAPSVTFAHTGVRIALVDVAGGKGGVVEYNAGAAGDHAFFLSADVPVAFQTADGAALTVETSEAVDACSAVAVQHIVELEVGTVRLTFGPTDAETVTLVTEAISQ